MAIIRISAYVPPSAPSNSLLKPEKAQRFLVPIDTSKTVGDLFRSIDKRFKENYCKGNAQLSNNFFIVKLQDAHGNDLDCLDAVRDIFGDSSNEQHQVTVIRGSLSRMSSIPVGSALHPAGYTLPSSSLSSFVKSSDPNRSLDDIAEEDYYRLNADRPLTSTESAESLPPIPGQSKTLNPYAERNAASQPATTYSQDLEPNLTDNSQSIQEQKTSPRNDGFLIPALPKRKLISADTAGSSNLSEEPSKKRAKSSSASSLHRKETLPLSGSCKHTTSLTSQRPEHDMNTATTREQARHPSRSPEPRTAPANPPDGPSENSNPLDPNDMYTMDYGGSTPPGFYVNYINSPEVRAARSQKESDFDSSAAAQESLDGLLRQGIYSSAPRGSAPSASSGATPNSSSIPGRTVWTTLKRPTPTASRKDSPGSPACARCKRGKRKCERDGKAKCLRCRRNDWECWTDAPEDLTSSQCASTSGNGSASVRSLNSLKLDKGKQKATDPFTMSADLARKRASGLFKGVLIREGGPNSAITHPASSQPSPTQQRLAGVKKNLPISKGSGKGGESSSEFQAASVARYADNTSLSQPRPLQNSANPQTQTEGGENENADGPYTTSASLLGFDAGSSSEESVKHDINAHASRHRTPRLINSVRHVSRFDSSDVSGNTSNESRGTTSDEHNDEKRAFGRHSGDQTAVHQRQSADTKRESQPATAPSDSIGDRKVRIKPDDSEAASDTSFKALGGDVKYEPARSSPIVKDVVSPVARPGSAETSRDSKPVSLLSSSSSDDDIEQRSSDEDDAILQSQMRTAIERAGPSARPGTPGQKRLQRSFSELITSTWPSFSSQKDGERPWYDVPEASPWPKQEIEDQATNFVF